VKQKYIFLKIICVLCEFNGKYFVEHERGVYEELPRKTRFVTSTGNGFVARNYIGRKVDYQPELNNVYNLPISQAVVTLIGSTEGEFLEKERKIIEEQKQLVKQLGHRKYLVREKAQKLLIERKAIAAVEEGSKDSDLEISDRCKHIISILKELE
jgi:hypothetical protein